MIWIIVVAVLLLLLLIAVLVMEYLLSLEINRTTKLIVDQMMEQIGRRESSKTMADYLKPFIIYDESETKKEQKKK